jgi:predicted DNA-binding ribbon-helix-helix protein
MCRIFISADPKLWQSRVHSLRLHGQSTSIRLENLYWGVLEEIGARDGLSLNILLTRLHDELVEERGEVENFASFLRVCCGRYLLLQRDGLIPADHRVPIRSLDADAVLAAERNSRRPRRFKLSPRSAVARVSGAEAARQPLK